MTVWVSSNLMKMVEQNGRKERKEKLTLDGQNTQMSYPGGYMLLCVELIIMPAYYQCRSVGNVAGPFFSRLVKDASLILQHVALNYITLQFQQTLKMLKSYCFWFHSRDTCVKLPLSAILHSSQIIFWRKNTASNIIDKINHKDWDKIKDRKPCSLYT